MTGLTTRTKYMMVKLLIAAGLTTAVILVLRYYIEKEATEEINLALNRAAEQVKAVVTAQEELNATGAGQQNSGGRSAMLQIPRDSSWAKRMGELFACEVSIVEQGRVLESSLADSKQRILEQKLAAGATDRQWTVSIEGLRYQARFVSFGNNEASPVVLVMKSWAEVESRQRRLSRLLTILAIAATLIGFPLVLRVSDTFGKPLSNLVGAVRALEAGDYNYPVMAHSHDELEEVTQAFEHMRSSLQKSQKQLLQKERLATIGEMASSISHDLRHTLTTVVANAEFLAEANSTQENRAAFYQEIRMAVEQMNDLIEALLEFSRGRETPRLIRLNFADVAERALRSVRGKAGYQQIHFTEAGPKTLECEIDPMKIERALVNLLVNACEAVPAEAGRVELRWEQRDGHLLVRVADNGPGVVDEIRAELFQPFVSHGKAAGTGLGLAIVRKICEEHGGSAILESSEPGNTAFRLTLPSTRP
ncbi:MAG TPA: HAMP domain-containing sensor histidine kinase [Candidatus Acidoferrum sp.]|nr:HAMP domain-containing sensor histidine kinase [Candidatus Acidoferrum sp.]